MGDVSADEHLQSSLNCFCTKPGILSLLRNRLRLNDVTLSISSPLVVLRGLYAWFSIFDTAHLTDLCSKTGYCRLTNLKISNNLLIHHVGSYHSDHNFTLT